MPLCLAGISWETRIITFTYFQIKLLNSFLPVPLKLMRDLSFPRRRLVLFIFFTIFFFLYALPAQISPTDFIHDDSYFYLQVASNIVKGHGSTFNEITPTNGYHPLWLLASVLVFLLAGSDKLLALHLTVGLQVALFIVIAYYFRKTARLFSLKIWLIGLAILATYFLSTGIYASEAHLNGFVLTLSLYYFTLALTTDRPVHWIMVSLFAGFAVLSRLDNIFVAGSIIWFGFLNTLGASGEKLLKRLITLSLPFTIILTPYLIYNLLTYGNFIPISGAIKGTFPEMVFDVNNLGSIGKFTLIFGFLSIILSLNQKEQVVERTLLRALGVGILLHAGYIVCFTDHYTFWAWYYVSGILNFSIVTSVVLQKIVINAGNISGQKLVSRMPNLIAALFATAGLSRGWIKSIGPISVGPVEMAKINEYRWPDEIGIWMKNNLPENSAIFVHDWPGAIAYYSDMRVLPMDGLMSDFKYNDDLEKMGINQYLCEHQVKLFFGPVLNEGEGESEFEVAAPLSRMPVGKIQLSAQNIVARVKDIVKIPEDAPNLALWSIHPCE
jgi:hypothetical protein